MFLAIADLHAYCGLLPCQLAVSSLGILVFVNNTKLILGNSEFTNSLSCFSFSFLVSCLCVFSSLFCLHFSSLLLPNTHLHRWSPEEADIWVSVEFPFIFVSFPLECFVWNLQLQMAKGGVLVTEKATCQQLVPSQSSLTLVPKSQCCFWRSTHGTF